MKKFNSLKELEKYIQSTCNPKALEKIGEDMVDKMKEIVQEEVYDKYTPVQYQRYDEIFNAVRVTEINNRSVEVSIEDNGHWTSVDGRHFYPLYGLEAGKTWGEGSTPDNPKYRPQTNIQELSEEEAEKLSKETYIEFMKQKGFDIR